MSLQGFTQKEQQQAAQRDTELQKEDVVLRSLKGLLQTDDERVSASPAFDCFAKNIYRHHGEYKSRLSKTAFTLVAFVFSHPTRRIGLCLWMYNDKLLHFSS